MAYVAEALGAALPDGVDSGVPSAGVVVTGVVVPAADDDPSVGGGVVVALDVTGLAGTDDEPPAEGPEEAEPGDVAEDPGDEDLGDVDPGDEERGRPAVGAGVREEVAEAASGEGTAVAGRTNEGVAAATAGAAVLDAAGALDRFAFVAAVTAPGEPDADCDGAPMLP